MSQYTRLLLSHYPKTVDIPSETLIVDTPNGISNLSIYENSFMSVVTETNFSEEGGLFITEKTIRPIAVGHPYMILGQPNILKKLNELGFKTDFEGLDTSYDSIEDNTERFLQFHRSLIDWVNVEDKFAKIQSWKDTIDHNFEIYRKTNFKKTMIDCAILSTKHYFTV
jgi:hypothetical protein